MEQQPPEPKVRDLLKWLHEIFSPYIPENVQTHIVQHIKDWYIKVSKEE